MHCDSAVTVLGKRQEIQTARELHYTPTVCVKTSISTASAPVLYVALRAYLD